MNNIVKGPLGATISHIPFLVMTWAEPAENGWHSPYPPALQPQHHFRVLVFYSLVFQEQYLLRRGFALLMIIEGLRSGIYVAPPEKTVSQLLSCARRKFRRLAYLGKCLGFSTNGYFWGAALPVRRI